MGCLLIKAHLKLLPDISKTPEDTTHIPSRELWKLHQLGTEGTENHWTKHNPGTKGGTEFWTVEEKEYINPKKRFFT